MKLKIRLGKLSFILLSLFALQGVAQPGPLMPEENPAVQPEFNPIRFYGGEESFNRFYRKLDTLFFGGTGKVNIVHFGGSHIQADMWTDQVRGHLQTMMPAVNGGRGFLFPFKMAKTNNPSGYDVNYTGEWVRCRSVTTKDTNCLLGLSGLSVTTRDSLTSMRIDFRDNPRGYYFTRVKLFYPADSSFSVVFPADSILASWRDTVNGFTEYILPYPQDTLYVEFHKTDSTQKHFTLFGVSLENADPGIVYHAIGANGASVPSYNRCVLLTQHLTALDPDLVILSIGINDSHAPDFSLEKYIKDHDTLLASIKKAAPDAVILFTTNSDSYFNRREPNRKAFEVRKAMETMSEQHGAGVWDLFGVMGELTSIRKWEAKGLAQRDRVHLTREGYRLLGDMLFNALLNAYGDHLARN